MNIKKLFEMLKDVNKRKRILSDYINYLHNQLIEIDNIARNSRFNTSIAEKDEYGIMPRREKELRHLLYSCYQKRKLIEITEDTFESFDYKTRVILENLYINGNTWEFVELDMGVSRSTISRHRDKAIKMLMQNFRRFGITNEDEIDRILDNENTNNTLINYDDELIKNM